MNLCPVCHTGRLHRRSTVYLEWHGKRWLVVDRMPAMVCDVCDERIYDRDAMEYLQRLLWSNPLQVPQTIANRNNQEVKHKAA